MGNENEPIENPEGLDVADDIFDDSEVVDEDDEDWGFDEADRKDEEEEEEE